MADSPDILLFPLTGIDAAPPRPRDACSSANTNGVSTLDTGNAVVEEALIRGYGIQTMKRLYTLLALLFSILGTQTPSQTADEPLPVFLCVGGSNMIGGRSKLEDLPKELKGEQAKALFFDGPQWLPLSAEKMNKRGFGCEVSFAASMSEKLGRTIGIIKHSSHGTSPETV